MSDFNDPSEDNQEKGSVIRGVFGLISFSTILPINIHCTIEEMARFTWFWPIIGAFIGIIVGAFGYLLVDLLHLPSLIAAALIYSFSIWFTGFHHLDGLIDFGDGMMVHGSPEKKIDVMRDKRIGTGGIAYFGMVALVTFAAIGSAPAALIFYLLVISEMASKIGIITCATFSKPFPNGTGKSFIDSMNKKILLISFIVTSALGFLIFNTTGIIGICAGLISGLIIALIAQKNFKWATGDILGTSNEVARMLALLVMVALSI
jgi:adenosylcobinamide-GDP ribazoletransferase